MTDAVIQALVEKCGMTTIEAIDTWNVVREAMGKSSTDKIIDAAVAARVDSAYQAAIDAANSVDMRAGDAVAAALATAKETS